jgi:hypothetical protein
MGDIQSELDQIRARNERVEADKAWETSLTRRAFIAALTYGCAGLYMQVMGFPAAWAGAMVPVAGYLISTLSLPLLKALWHKKIRKI